MTDHALNPDAASSSWISALEDQGDSSSRQQVAASVLATLDAATKPAPVDIGRVLDVPVLLTAELGRTRITIKSLLQLSQGSVVELDGLAGQPLDVLINGYLIAQGEVVVINEKYGIRLTDIITPSERVQKLARG